MTLFEYLSIGTSLILSFSLARSLTNLAPIFRRDRRYWVHVAWVLGLLFFHISLFWQLWLFRDVESWTLLGYVLLLMGPILLLIGVSLLIPAESVDDYRAYFESIRVPAYSVLIAIQLQNVPLLYVAFDVPVTDPLHFSAFVLALAFAVGLIMRKRVVDVVLISIWIVAAVSGLYFVNDHELMRSMFLSMRG